MDKTMKTIVNAAVKTLGYYFDHSESVLYVSKKFYKLSSIYNTAEYHALNSILDQFEDVTIQIHSKEKNNDSWSYEQMKKYINMLPDADKHLAEYEKVVLMSHAYRGSYKFVFDWFKKQFPNYAEATI